MSSLHLLDTYLPRTETFIWQVLRKLRRYPPLVMAGDTANLESFPLPNGEVVEVPGERPLWARLAARAAGDFAKVRFPGAEQALRGKSPVVCHVHKGFQALVTRDFTRELGIPLLVNFYGSDVSQRPFLRRAARGYRDVFAQAHDLLVEGPAMRARLISLGAPEDKIREQRIAIDLDDYAFRERSWDGNREVRLLFVGRMVEKKGLAIGLRALADARVDFPWRLTVIGDGPLRPALTGLAQRLGIADRVEFGGWRTPAQVRAALNDHDLLLQPSRTASDGDGEGGAPTILLEAQACGMPVISTTHDDIPHVTVPDLSAWLVPQGDVAGLAEALCRAAEQSERWGAMGRAGRDKVGADHEIRGVAASLEELYARAAGES